MPLTRGQYGRQGDDRIGNRMLCDVDREKPKPMTKKLSKHRVMFGWSEKSSEGNAMVSSP